MFFLLRIMVYFFLLLYLDGSYAEDNKENIYIDKVLCTFIKNGFLDYNVKIIYGEMACPEVEECDARNYKALIMDGDNKGKEIGITKGYGGGDIVVGQEYIVFLKQIDKNEKFISYFLVTDEVVKLPNKDILTYKVPSWVTYEARGDGIFININDKLYRKIFVGCEKNYTNDDDCNNFIKELKDTNAGSFYQKLMSAYILYENFENELTFCKKVNS